MKKKTWIILGAVVAVIVIIAALIAGTYNSLVTLQTTVEEKQSTTASCGSDPQLRRVGERLYGI